jgi:hypothetical protein
MGGLARGPVYSGLRGGADGSVVGNVRAGASVAQSAQVQQNQRIVTGNVVTTGPASSAILRFDDGSAIALHENSEFRVTDYAYSPATPANDRSVLELVKGALRSVTGALGQRTPQAYSMRTVTATIGIRGTDFMLALVNPAYMSVLDGAIAATNTAGSVTFAAGTTAVVQTAATLAVAIPAASLPAAVASAFSQLGALPLAAGSAGAGAQGGAGGASGAAAGGISGGVIGAAAAIIGIAAAIAAENNDQPVATSGTGTTGTP